MKLIVALLALALAGCTKTVTEYRDVIVHVPVPVPCVDERPVPVTSLSQRFTREEWDALSTDQRNNLLLANGLNRVVYENDAEVVLAACGSVSRPSADK